jgi:hypothetical protein
MDSWSGIFFKRPNLGQKRLKGPKSCFFFRCGGPRAVERRRAGRGQGIFGLLIRKES